MWTDIKLLIRQWAGWLVVAGVAALVVYIGLFYTKTKSNIDLSTAGTGGYYHAFGEDLREVMRDNPRYTLELSPSGGSKENELRLRRGETDLAIVQASAVEFENFYAVMPLWDDYFQVIVRKGSKIRTLKDLEGRNVSLGGEKSGYFYNAKQVLDYYGVDWRKINMRHDSAANITDDGSPLDGMVVTTSLANPSIKEVLRSGKFELMPITGTAGFVFNNTYYRESVIPAGVYQADGAPLPAEPIVTVSTDAVLAARSDVPPSFVNALMPVLHGAKLRAMAPHMVQRKPNADRIWSLLPMHPDAKRFFNPYEGLGVVADFFDLLGKFKELILLGLVLIVVAIVQWRQHRRLAGERRRRAQSRELEHMFRELLDLDMAQKEAKDIRLLQDQLKQLNYLKTKAMKTALGTNLQETSLFGVFLQHANSVVREVEWRLQMASSLPSQVARKSHRAENVIAANMGEI